MKKMSTTNKQIHEMLPITWRNPKYGLYELLQTPEFQEFNKELLKLEEQKILRPEYKNIFKALEQSTPDAVKVIILGQDPYPKPNDAIGLSFAVQKEQPIPRSLKNIYTELYNDLGVDNRETHGDLTQWAAQGVLLLNTTLTTQVGESNIHKKSPWTQFTSRLLFMLTNEATADKPLIFVLWGKDAQEKGEPLYSPFISKIESPHPSPFSARKGFFGSKPFSQINEQLTNNNQAPIDWQLS